MARYRAPRGDYWQSLPTVILLLDHYIKANYKKFSWGYFLLGLNLGVASHALFVYMHAVSQLRKVLNT